MIEVKATFSGWHKVTRDEAKRFVKHLKKGIMAIHPDKINQYINDNKLKGITVEELNI